MNFDLFLSKAAVADIEEALDWYEKPRKGLGYEFELSIEAGITALQRNPLHCPKKYDDIRVKYIKRFPYGIHYEVDEMSIKIIAVFHMKQSPLRWDNRLLQDDLE